ncbi:MAG TPA: hypothetical protein VNA89_13845 [Gemmatimonadaceae bacterium]|nr:hypothetical protein [Gemmatimonadaceae bacterium]
MSRRGGALLLALGVAACGGCATPAGAAGRARAVLFIGNSLTYTNDLPAIVQALADSSGERLRVEGRTAAGASLADHWAMGTREALRERPWTVVVLQQGPSSTSENRADLRAWTARWAQAIRAAGARPALYMVWPEAARTAAFPAVVESYTLAARDVDGLLFPAGAAWLAAWRRDAALPLYGPDEFHPSPTGSYLAALVVYARLFDRSPVGLPARLRLTTGAIVAVDPARAALLQAAAAEAAGVGVRAAPR